MKLTLWILTLSLLLLSLQEQGLDAKRVVLIPAPCLSHSKNNVKVAQALHNLGHQVWIALPTYLLQRGVLDTSGFTVIPYELSLSYEELLMQKTAVSFLSGKGFDLWKVASDSVSICDEILRNKDLEQRIRDVRPDLLVLTNVPPVFTLFVLPYKLQVPFAMMAPFYDVHAARIPFSSAVNALHAGTISDDKTFFERVKSMFLHAMPFIYNPFMPRDLVSIYAPERPYIPNYELAAQAEIWLAEMDHIMDYARPALPNVKLIGATVTGDAKPLPPELQAFMDGATHGVVIITFGGSVDGVPKHISNKLFQVFQDLPYKVVFRSNLTSPDSAKVWTSKWLPQNDLLGHPNTKVFVSHCGSNGQYEALFHAIPILCTPLFAEQAYNGERIRQKGYGEVVDIHTITQKELLSVILTVAQEPRYKQAISKASTLFRQQYGSPTLEAAKWLDHVMEYGGEYMRYAGQKIPLYQFLGLDVFAFVFALGVLTCMMMYCCVKMLCRCCLKRKPKTD